ncbi:miniconductance mechanosensitive channel [Lysinibacillus composti]|uniref:Mechanosensing system component YbdG n=1 Tax=Lysinibacillus composti TaxID=720633 RepID=A0A3N9UCH6_9BACI|nr:mechanosensitive ion channel domain-containing protein [Lysinibacillus composti]MBM7609270.1 miniconductance mechanosensitive channel [Lysinibacillus composti]RQW74080.1 mechanosensitive ion channel family protein [Lysinibacillus composti]
MKFINKQLINYGVDPTFSKYLSVVLLITFIVLICVIANFITKKIVIRLITHIVNNNKFQWDNILLEKKVFHKLSHFVPAIIIYYFAQSFPTYQSLIEKGAITYIILVALSVLNTLLNAVNDIYQNFEVSKVKPIKGYIQVVKIVVFVLGIILVIANLIGESPLIILSGLGALSAVLLLVFRDSLLGLVAGIQLTSNDMVRVGDWIEMPKYGADGDVIDLSLNTVKVQNFDKTITTIPSYALISDSFKNWRGMQVTGGRRIKRSIFIDTTSISFCSMEMIEKFRNIHYLTNYIETRQHEIAEFNIKNRINISNSVNGRALTNIGVFRAYISQYIKNHPGIHKEMTTMVRQLAPTEHGLPIEIYAFSNDVNWAVYESIQSDIFDHLFAVAPEFGLRLFQNPTGNDFKVFTPSPLNNTEPDSH